jgi:predicted dehydrogenase
MKVGIIGCGLIGNRRAQVLRQSLSDELVIVADVDGARAETLAQGMDCLAETDWQKVVERPDLEIIVVATPNKFLAPVTITALERGKHVLCEKPPGRNFNETESMAAAARRTGRILKVGFNHRFHPAIWQAHAVCQAGNIGTLMLIRAVYGHGGRPGYDQEWRANADLAGGGELLDQGIHIIDLCRWFMGNFTEAASFTPTYYWDLGYFEATEPSSTIRVRLEDNAFAMLSTESGQVAQFHTSWTQWKNRFSFEVLGHDGYVRVDGLGGSYGLETLTTGYRRPESGPPHEEHTEFPGPDESWQAEWREFTAAIRERRRPLADVEDSLGTMSTIAALYEAARTGQVVSINYRSPSAFH